MRNGREGGEGGRRREGGGREGAGGEREEGRIRRAAYTMVVYRTTLKHFVSESYELIKSLTASCSSCAFGAVGTHCDGLGAKACVTTTSVLWVCMFM